MDGITLDDYPRWAKAHWQNIKRGLEWGYYCPQPVKRVEIPKPNGGIRLLGIPTVNDRLIQQAIVQRLQPLIEFKRLKGKSQKAKAWLSEVRERDPYLFVHWKRMGRVDQ